MDQNSTGGTDKRNWRERLGIANKDGMPRIADDFKEPASARSPSASARPGAPTIKPAPMAPPGMPPGAPPPPQGGPPPAQDGGRVRSAMEQAGGAQGDMVPGEGGAFSEVRAGADQMAADIGSQLEV